MSLAALPMYDFPELRWATDAFWKFVAEQLNGHGISAPIELTRGIPLHELWTDPDLLLAQTCGYPLVTSLAGKVTLIATPCYGAPGCDGPLYRSAIIVRTSDPAASLADLRGRRCAINDPASNSGMNVLRAAIAPLAQGAPGFFSAVIITGAHTASMQAVATGRADVAAIDCITWAHLQQLRPADTCGLRVLEWTDPTPGLPLITSLHMEAPICDALRGALDQSIADQTLAPARAALRLLAFAHLSVADYGVVLDHNAVSQEAVLC